jgi:hypothetical protein
MCGWTRGGSRASGARPGSLRLCRSCCGGPDLSALLSLPCWCGCVAGNKLPAKMAIWRAFVHSQWLSVKRLSLVVFSAPYPAQFLFVY